MKIIIEIPNYEFNNDVKDKFQDYFNRVKQDIADGTLCGNYELETTDMFLASFKRMQILSDNATNGDIIKTFFPNIIIQNRHNVTLEQRNPKHAGLEFTGMADINWWNTPYKEESK